MSTPAPQGPLVALRLALAWVVAVLLGIGGTLLITRMALPESAQPAEVPYSTPTFDVPKDTGASVDVAPELRADRLVLPPGSFQADIAPAGVDLTTTMYVYAMSSLEAPLLADYLTGHLSEGGWTVVSSESRLDGPTLDVVSPSGAKGALQVNATPPGVPGYVSAVSGALKRP